MATAESAPNHVILLVVLALVPLVGCATADSGGWALWPGQSATNATETAVLDAEQTADMQLALGRTAEQQKQWSRASAIYRRLLADDPDHPDATHRLAILYARQGDFEQSAQWFHKALKLKPGDPDLFCDLGYSLASQGRYREAQVSLQQAIAIAPEHERAHNHLGVVLAQQGMVEEAMVAFRRANCSLTEAHSNVAFVLVMNHKVDEARQHLHHAQQLPSGAPEAQQRLAELSTLISRQIVTSGPAVADARLIEAGRTRSDASPTMLR